MSIYLDHSATSPPLPQVVTALTNAWQLGYANPESQHAAGRKARKTLEQARARVAEMLGVQQTGRPPDQVLFTSGATEANNLALFGLCGSTPGRLLVSAGEHSSILRPAAVLHERGWDVELISLTNTGTVDLAALARQLETPTQLVSVQLANHETGVLQPLSEIAALCAARSVPWHTDATQAAGKVPLDFHALGCAALSCSGHKFQGPQGIGLLLIRSGTTLQPQLYGGFQQGALRPGTECVPLALGLVAALEAWHENRIAWTAHLAELRKQLEQQLAAALPGMLVNGSAAGRLPQIANLSFPPIDRQQLFLALDLAGICCATGSACASGSSEPSPVLRAMHLPEPAVLSALRFSLGPQNTAAEVETAVTRIVAACQRLR